MATQSSYVPLPNATAPAPAQRQLFGHPLGLFVLFFTELWERFSFYGMKALLILYMVNYLVWTQEEASHVLAWYAGLVYCTPVLGGILADKVFGARWSVLGGGILIAIGHFLLAFEPLPFFYSGLGFLIAGVGLLKPNISTQVGSLYAPGDARRDSAFTIFYMGINTGALLGPIVCARLMEHPAYGFHYGFGAAGVGMVIGLIVYVIGMRWVVRQAEAVAAISVNQSPPVHVPRTDQPSGEAPVAPHVHRDRVIVLLVMFVFAVIFWMAFEQAANVMTIWADKHTNLYPFRADPPRAVVDDGSAGRETQTDSSYGFSVTAPDLLAVNPFFIVTLAVAFAWLWVWLEKRRWQPSSPAKFVLGFVGMSMAYAVMMLAARAEAKPSAAPLNAVPPGVTLEKYGATRLRYDPQTKMLQMHGVLTDLDRLRLSRDSAPASYRAAVEELAERAKEKSQQVDRQQWHVDVNIPEEAAGPAQPESLPQSVQWDAGTRTLTATAVLSERDLLTAMAAGGPREFHAAVDRIYSDSSLHKVSLWWLILFYLLCTMGELCLSPVGLSFVTKMAPPRYVGLFMGLWFLFTGGVANFLAHFIGGRWGTMTPVDYFLIFGGLSVAATVLMLLMVRLLRRMMHGVQ